jgi:hypothetical protein
MNAIFMFLNRFGNKRLGDRATCRKKDRLALDERKELCPRRRTVM